MVNSGERKTKAFFFKKSNKVESLIKEGDSPVDFTSRLCCLDGSSKGSFPFAWSSILQATFVFLIFFSSF